ncbi:YebG protein [Klebsiella pneumoniae]|nr:YebG protein [Klebsiella pneumoniae]
MAVEIKYVVVRKGEEKMTFASKKEADAYDKMLDMAEVLSDWLSASPLEIDEQQGEALGLYLAENKDALQQILRTGKLPEENSAADGSEDAAQGKLRAV